MTKSLMGKLQSGGVVGEPPSGIGRSAPVSVSDIWTLAEACGANAL